MLIDHHANGLQSNFCDVHVLCNVSCSNITLCGKCHLHSQVHVLNHLGQQIVEIDIDLNNKQFVEDNQFIKIIYIRKLF